MLATAAYDRDRLAELVVVVLRLGQTLFGLVVRLQGLRVLSLAAGVGARHRGVNVERLDLLAELDEVRLRLLERIGALFVSPARTFGEARALEKPLVA